MKVLREDGPYLGAHLSRRGFLAAAAASLVIPLDARAASEQVHDLRGRVTINNRPATTKSDILPGDRIATGNDGHFVFVMGQDAIMLRSRSELAIERYEDSQGLLKLVTGALGAVFGVGRARRIVAANVTAGIRGTAGTSAYTTSKHAVIGMMRSASLYFFSATSTRARVSSTCAKMPGSLSFVNISCARSRYSCASPYLPSL